MTIHVPRVLSIAGTDPTGGAGAQADIKSITAAGGYAMNVTTCLVAQNTRGVEAVHTPDVGFLRKQLEAVSSDVVIDAVKTGMLGSTQVIAEVTGWLTAHRPPVVVVDPVMVATSGDRLLSVDAEQAMREFCRLATVITPNIGELAVLVGAAPAVDEATALAQAHDWVDRTGVAVVVKTGHLGGQWATNHWVGAERETITVPTRRVDTTSTHGTGCSLSSGLATRLAAGDSPAMALGWVSDWLNEAIEHGAELGVGQGHGPVDHSHRARRLAVAADPSPWLDPLDPAAGDAPELIAPDATPVDPVVAPVGPWTTALWRASTETIRLITGNRFVRSLVSGDLPATSFEFYLGQDTLYLAEYAKALALLAAKAPDPSGTEFWARSVLGCVATEAAMHRGFLGEQRVPIEAGPVTDNYRNFLVATTAIKDYAVGVAVVLPCYWLYAQVAGNIPAVDDDHPYAEWLRTYHDPAFVDLTRECLHLVEKAFCAASAPVRRDALRAHLLASRHELEFFDQASRFGPGPETRR